MTGLTTAVGLDIGSNTFSCCTLKRLSDNTVHLVRDDSIPVRLSEGLTLGCPLKPEAVARGLMTLKQLAADFDMHNLQVKAVATAVLRMTSAPEAFIVPAQEIIGAPIEIIDGDTEALLTSHGAVLEMPHASGRAVLDIGGQSTELCRQNPDNRWVPASMPFGVVSLTERFVHGARVTPAEVEAMRLFIRGILNDRLDRSAFSVAQLVCVGGTATSLSALQQQLSEWNRDLVHCHRISAEDTLRWLGVMTSLSTAERIAQYGLRPMRADVFLAGIAVLVEVMDFLRIDHFTTSANGLRVGVALSILGEDPTAGKDL